MCSRPNLRAGREGQTLFRAYRARFPLASGHGVESCQRAERVDLAGLTHALEPAFGALEWTPGEPMRYPAVVEITRPADGYVLTIRFLRLRLNVDVPEDGFELKPPEGARIKEIGEQDGEEGGEENP